MDRRNALVVVKPNKQMVVFIVRAEKLEMGILGIAAFVPRQCL